ncbi:MAG: 2-polyprenylphenol 6-hydroxylase [Rhizobiales bacterium]|nr:2-polyprenylphenol 6-hydroxylase [Hyphomicrobiales bacterium]
MFSQIAHCLRLIRAARVMARYDGLVSAEQLDEAPPAARLALRIAKIGTRAARGDVDNPLAAALTELGPTYIKLGQFLATRPDLVGADRARQLSELQDRMPSFPQDEAIAEIRAGLGADTADLFEEFGPPVAAASIAQVHRAKVRDDNGGLRDVAVKVLRPGIEKRFSTDMETFFFAARLVERWHEPSRRLRPVDAVQTLATSVKLEMDLRMEASAMSELAKNVADDAGFHVPQVDWSRTSRRILTSQWVDGIPLSDQDRLKAAGFDLPGLGDNVIQSFLRHAIRDGFFHADMHPGNLFVDQAGDLVAVDFGIMGRLGMKERLFLAEILHGFITRNYERVSQVHFDAGYVPIKHDPQVFAQALRAIGEPLMDKPADEISMARLLAQLFQVTEQFDMRTQPQLLLLQKTMVVVEGVARMLNPSLNMWTTAEPVVRQWIEQKFGPQGRIEDAAEGAATLGKLVGALPEVMAEAQRTAHMLSNMADSGGIRLDKETTEALAEAQSRRNSGGRIALWLGAAALVVIALAQVI